MRDCAKKLLIGGFCGFVGIVLCARLVIRVSEDRSSSVDVETEETRETVELITDGTDDVHQRVKYVYAPDEDVKKSRKEFLGDLYDGYNSVIELIESNSDKVFESIPEGRDEGYAVDLGLLYFQDLGIASGRLKEGSLDTSDMVVDKEKEYTNFYIWESLTIIDYFDNTRVIYAYNYPENLWNELVVVDYVNDKINTEITTDVMKIGDVKSVGGDVDHCKILKLGDFYVLYLRV